MVTQPRQSLFPQAAAGESIESSAHAQAAPLSCRRIRIERHTAVRLRNEGHINDEALRHPERELDLSETHLDAMPYH
jgi:hypothetical protein